MKPTFVLALSCLLAGFGAGCSSPDEPIRDGYTLTGVVVDPEGTPVEGVSVFNGWETSIELMPYAETDAEGTFVFHGFPATAPTREVFRFSKESFGTRDVAAKEAVRTGDYRFRLEVVMMPAGGS